MYTLYIILILKLRHYTVLYTGPELAQEPSLGQCIRVGGGLPARRMSFPQ